MTKKVVHLISTNVFSGAENVACQIINMYKDSKEYDMIYLAEMGSNEEILNDKNIKYYKLDKFNYSNVKKAIKELKPDIIHAHDIKASIIASLFYKQVKIVSHIHCNHANMRKLNLKTFLYNLTCKKYDKIIWVSQSALDNYYFFKKVVDKSCVLYNVVDIKEIKKKIENDNNIYKYDIIYLGRLTYAKNPLRLVRILNELILKNKELKVAIVGNGDMYEDVKKEIEKLKLTKNIKMYGFVSNPYKILKSSKIMVMTSRYEGTPMCALEAIACELPIVSTATDGLNEIVINDKTGYLSNDDNVIIEKIETLLNDEEYFNKTKNNVKQFNLKVNNIEEYKKIIDKIYK